MHTYSTRANKHVEYHILFANNEHPYAEIIKVEDSDTDMGHHEALINLKKGEENRERSPSRNSNASDAATEPVDNDGNSQMGDEERFQTPQREMPYRPGSVAETPRRARIVKNEPPVGRFGFWQEQDGVVLRLSFGQDGEPMGAEAQVQEDQQPAAEIEHVRNAVVNAVEAYRRSVTPHRYRSPDDDAASVTSDATVRVDPRATPQPTLSNGAMPLVRHPTYPADYDFNAPGPSGLNRLSTIQEGGDEEAQWPPRIPEQQSGIHMLRDATGRWVRMGSLGPDAAYQINPEDLPPRIDLEEQPAPQPQAGPSRRPRLVPEVVITTTPRRARPVPEVVITTTRRRPRPIPEVVITTTRRRKR